MFNNKRNEQKRTHNKKWTVREYRFQASGAAYSNLQINKITLAGQSENKEHLQHIYTKISCMYYINLIPAATGTYFVIDCLARKLTTVSRSQFLKQKKSMLKYNNL